LDIEKIIIENFKGIERIELGPVKPINVLVGRNNTGKSSTLTALEYLSKAWTNDGNIATNNEVASKHFRLNRDDESKPFSVSVLVTRSEDEHREVFNKIINNWNKSTTEQSIQLDIVEGLIKNNFLEKIVFYFTAEPDDPKLFLRKVEGSDKREFFTLAQYLSRRRVQENAFVLAPIFMLLKQDRFNPSQPILSQLPEMKEWKNYATMSFDPSMREKTLLMHNSFCIDIIKPVLVWVRNIFSRTFIIPPVRHAQEYGTLKGSKPLEPAGNNLVSCLNFMETNNNFRFRKIVKFVSNIAPEVGRFHSRQASNNQLELAYEWKENEIVRLVDMGGGIEQLLALACFLGDPKNKFMLWEEPEVHLHPGAQDILLNEIEKKIGKRIIFLTTHSPVFIRRSEKIAVHALTSKDGKSATGRTLSSSDFNQVINIIGSRPGHLAQADIVLYVEGKRGAEVVEEWLEKWTKRETVLCHLELLVQPFNADEVGSDDFDLDKLKLVSPNMIIFVDKDNDEGDDKPKKTRITLGKKCKAGEIPFIITEKRQIDDYFPKELVSNVLKKRNPQLSKEWEQTGIFTKKMKRYNREISRMMEWSNVEKYKEIKQIFEEIEKYAKKLKPDEHL